MSLRRAGILLILLVLGAGVSADAQRPRRPNSPLGRRSPNFFADVASFPGAGSTARAEVFVSIPLRALTPEAPGDFRGRADVLVIFYNSDGDQITGDEWSYHNIPLGKSAAENQGRFLNRRYTFELPPGKIEVKIQVADSVQGRRNEKRINVEIPDYSKHALKLSSPVFGVCRETVVTAPEGSFYGPVLPLPSRRYGDEVPDMCVYYEVSDDQDVPGDYRVHYKLKSAYGQTWQDTTFTQERTRGGVTGLLLHPRGLKLTTGRYELEVHVRLGDEEAKQKSLFSMDETRMAFEENPDKLRTIMQYVATNEEKAALDSMPDDSLGVFWEGFWQRRDPDPDSAVNEALAQFLERVDYVTDEFGVLEPGWKSDRGRIYIKFGAPDQVEEFYTETYRYPTLIWYYYSRNRNYVFQDQEGFGRYRLVGMQED